MLPMVEDKYKGMFVGLAIGDTLGMPLEFKQLGSFEPIHALKAGGPFDLPLGYWTDDTSMALCLADSILDKQGYDSYDVMGRYANWRDKGYRSSTGVCFDIGNQVSSALSSYRTNPEVAASEPRTESAGNGCIMRLAPVVIASMAANNGFEATMRLAAVSGRETHYSVLAEEATALFAGLLFNAVKSNSKDQILQLNVPDITNDQLLKVIQNASEKTESQLQPTGFVVDTLEVAVWAFMTTDNFKDGALKAVNLGGDSDTIGAVYGQLAGAYYGLAGIPQDWLDQLYECKEIEQLAIQLSALNTFDILKTRFSEDQNTELVKLDDKEQTMTDDNQSQEPLTDKDKAVLRSWSNVGSPGPAPATPFVPSDEQKEKFQPIKSPKTISVQWLLDEEAYKRLQLGHLAHEMEDKWNIYMEGDTVHFHRSWTGMELFRFTVQPADGGHTVSQFEVEQDPERYTETDEQAIKDTLSEVMQAVLGVGLAATNQSQ